MGTCKKNVFLGGSDPKKGIGLGERAIEKVFKENISITKRVYIQDRQEKRRKCCVLFLKRAVQFPKRPVRFLKILIWFVKRLQ